MAAKLGLEPRQTESESAVLPLHHFAPEPKMAEKEGFEPSRRSKPTYSLSRGAPSTTWVLLQKADAQKTVAEEEGFEPSVP